MIELVNSWAALAVLQPAFHYEKLPVGLEINGSADGFSLVYITIPGKISAKIVRRQLSSLFLDKELFARSLGRTLTLPCPMGQTSHLLHRTPHVQPTQVGTVTALCTLGYPYLCWEKDSNPKTAGQSPTAIRSEWAGKWDQVWLFTICDRLCRRDGSDSLMWG